MNQLNTITNSYELFLLINEHRVLAGKKPMQKHIELVRKMQDELGEENLGNKKITKLFTEHSYGKKEFEAYEVTKRDVYLVAMRESKQVRASIYDYIESLEAENTRLQEFYISRQERLLGMTWAEACAYAGIYHANHCRNMLLDYQAKPFTYFYKNSSGNFVVTPEGVATGYFYNRGNKFTSNTTMKISKAGRQWLKENRDWFNKATDEWLAKESRAAEKNAPRKNQ